MIRLIVSQAPRKILNDPKKTIAEIGLVRMSIFIFTYMVNYIRESLHTVFLYENYDFNAMKYVLMVGYVSLIDGFLILGIYLFVAVLWKDMAWIQEMNWKQICTV